MLRSDRGGRHTALKVGAGIAAALLAIVILGVGSYWQSAFWRDAKHRADQHTAYAYYVIKNRCLSPPTESQAKCANDTIEAARSNERDEYDLYAQKTAALWTSIAGAAAAIGIALSAVGVWLVWLTFAEQRAANGIARKEADDAATSAQLAIAENARIGEAQVRCYLTATAASIGYTSCGDAMIKLSVKNSGQSPARKLRCVATVNHFVEKSVNRTSTPNNKHPIFEADIAVGGEDDVSLCVTLAHGAEENAVIASGRAILITLRVNISAVDVFGQAVTETAKFSQHSKVNALNQWIVLNRTHEIAG